MKSLLILFMLAIPIGVHGGSCTDAVDIVLKSSAKMNEMWWKACLTAATDNIGKNLCNEVHAAYKEAFKSKP